MTRCELPSSGYIAQPPCPAPQFVALGVAERTYRKHYGLTLTIEGSDVLPEKTFVSMIPNDGLPHELPPFTVRDKFWFNYHQVVFRAKSNTARLTISDWNEQGRPGGPVGQETMCNFIEVQPYWNGDE
jgi:hypothetical protein